MARSILSALAPARTAFTTLLDGEGPNMDMEFANSRVRDMRLRELKLYKEKLVLGGGRFAELYDKLALQEWGDDQDRVEAAIASDGPLRARLDVVKAEINVAIEEINGMKADAERIQQREQERQDRQTQATAQATAVAQAHAAAVAQLPAAAAAAVAAPAAPVIGDQQQQLAPELLRLRHMDVPKFSGNILQWSEFWDSFEAVYHNNRSLQPVQKLSALRGFLVGDAKLAISGMRVANDSYDRAVELLKQRFGRDQAVIDAHYNALSTLPPSSNQYQKLRSTVDQIEQHLNSLAALGQDIENNHVVLALIRSKLPTEVIYILEQARTEPAWTLKGLRDGLSKHLQNREVAETYGSYRTKPPSFERGESSNRDHHRDNHRSSNGGSHSSATAGALVAGSSSRSSTSGNSKRQCEYCLGKDHWSEKCKKYATLDARREQIKGRCFNCLREGHMVRDCNSDTACRLCSRKKHHHTSLCFKAFEKHRPSETVSVAAEAPGLSSNGEGSFLAAGETSILQTAQMTVQSPNSDRSATVRALLDPGSNRSYVSAELAQKLYLRPVGKESLSIYVFSTTQSKDIETAVVKIRLRQLDGSFVEIVASVVPQITGRLQRVNIDSNILKNEPFRSLKLADSLPSRVEDMNLEVLIGTDYYLDFIQPEKKRAVAPGLYLLATTFGWVLGGRQPASGELDRNRKITTLFVASTTMTSSSINPFSTADPYDEDLISLPRMWELETLGIKDHRIKDVGDEEAMARFNRTIEYRDGRYEVGLPWKNDDVAPPTNLNLAVGRLKSTLRRLEKQPELIRQYQEVFDTQAANNMIELVDDNCIVGERRHYLPHHPVITPHKATTKLRVVFDGSSKAKKGDLSLNECLYRGPVLLEHACALWIRFRLHPVGIVADIEKAFLQVGLKPEDRDVTRFVWLKDPTKLTTEDNLAIWRMTRVGFGIICSPFLLAGVIEYHLRKIGGAVAEDVVKNMYVDDITSGTNSAEKALEYYRETKTIFEAASMNVREWASNSKEFLDQVPACDRATDTTVSVLGYPWELGTDTFSIADPNRPINADITKRRILSFVSSYFDPLGLFSPIFVKCRSFLQELWTLQVGWDDPLSEDQRGTWSSLAADVEPIIRIALPRFIGIERPDQCEYALHCFCDASQRAYGAAVYLVIRDRASSKVTCHLIFGKSRLAPLSGLTLPRLELMAFFIGSKLLAFVEKSLPFAVMEKVMWTDSQIVLHWMRSTKTLPVFVRNRVEAIRSILGVEHRYVPTTDNPADIASRGFTATELEKSTLWWHGPTWLTEDKMEWPSMDFLGTVNGSEETEPRDVCFLAPEAAPAEPQPMPPLEIDIKRFKSLEILLRTTAGCFRFIRRLRKEEFESPEVTAEEISTARTIWIKYIQRKCFDQVLDAIKQKKSQPLIRELDLWIDEDGLLRCGGRLSNAALPESAKYPILLPKSDPFTIMLIQSYHEKLYHVGVAHTLSQIRNEFWIPQGRAVVFKVIRRCWECKKEDAGPYKVEKFASYPNARVKPSAPFSNTGLDYLGPLRVKGGAKVWIAIFTCLSTRAVHLEIVGDMTAGEFLQAFQCFIGRRGTPKRIWSDNAAQFKLAESVITDLWQDVISDKAFCSYISDRGISWNFITERAPWRGGFYERLIRLVKQSLKKSLGLTCLTQTQLRTVVTEIEAVINSRPLTYVGSDLDSGFALTPAHFLTPGMATGVPSVDLDEIIDDTFMLQISSKQRLLETWRKGQKQLERFWVIWKDQYLLSLRERSQSHLKQPRTRASVPPRVGAIVLVKDDGPRGSWKLARIEQLLPDSDGEVRSARVLLGTGNRVSRSLHHLYPLEVDVEEGEATEEDGASEEPKDRDATPRPELEVKRPTREAARRACIKIKNMFEHEESDLD